MQVVWFGLIGFVRLLLCCYNGELNTIIFVKSMKTIKGRTKISCINNEPFFSELHLSLPMQAYSSLTGIRSIGSSKFVI